jgi:4-carboxymuconolactone decarboxylase
MSTGWSRSATNNISANEVTVMNDKKAHPYADIAPALADITADVLFGEVWNRPGISPRDRSLVTIVSLISLYRTNELPFHLKRAMENGVTREEIGEILTHLAFYAGWPPVNTAIGIARQVFEEMK